MRVRLLVIAAALLQVTSLPKGATPPKLAVMIVVDQMRADYVERFQGEWTGGLKRLAKDGAWFRRAAYPYLDTLTCAGHATVATGAYPMTHGIFQNAWFDRNKNGLVTCTADPSVSALPYGRGRAGNESAINLKVPTFSEEMRQQKQSRTVSLSFKARSAIMLAGHSSDAVTWLSESLDGWETSTAFATAPVAAVKAYIDANPIEADFGKTWSLSMPAPAYQKPDAAPGEIAPAGWTTTFPHPLNGQSGKGPDSAFYAQWERSPFADAYLGRMAAGLVESMQLGTRDGTDVLTLSFSSPDLVGHGFGPDSVEIEDMYYNLDRTIGEFFDALDRLVGKGQWVVALTADHGVTEIPEQLQAAGRDGGRLDSQGTAAAVEKQIRQSLGGDSSVIRMVGNDIYLRPGALDRLVAKTGALDAVLKVAEGRPGIKRAFGANQLTPAAAASNDALLRAAALSYVPGRSGDIILAPKAGWMTGSPGSGTTHGSANDADQRVPIMFYGYGIKAGQYNDTASPADVAPTLAAITGITMPRAQGKALPSALAAPTGATTAARQ